MIVIQQGDILFIYRGPHPVKKKGEEAIELKNGELVIAEGESTGHRHSVRDTQVLAAEHPPQLRRYLNQLFLDVPEEIGTITIEHEEHETAELWGGRWEVRNVQEWDHFERRRRAVLD